MRSFIICLFLFFCVNGSVILAQQGQILWTPQQIQKKIYRQVIKETKYNRWAPPKIVWLAITTMPATIYMPQNFYTQNMGVVCKMELKLQKQIKFPLFIRLGSKDYTDGMEGKFSLHR